MTKSMMQERIQWLIDEGAVLPSPEDDPRLEELDEIQCAVDMFGDATPRIDTELDRYVDCWPTGHRTAPVREDEHFIDTDFILD